MRLATITLVLVVALLGRPLAAFADDDPSATMLLKQAADVFAEDADCGRALPLFQKAYELEHSWNALGGIATCHELSGRYDLAYALYEQILAEYGDLLPASRRARVSGHLAECDAHLARLQIETTPARAHVSVDGQDAVHFPLRLTAGVHSVVVTAPGHVPLSRKLTLAAGRLVRVSLELEALPSAASRVRPWLGRGLAVLSGAMVVGGGTLMILAERDYDAFDDAVIAGSHDNDPVDVTPERQDDGDRKNRLGGALIGSGVVVGVGAAILLLWPDAPARAPRPSVDVGAGTLGFGLSWSY